MPEPGPADDPTASRDRAPASWLVAIVLALLVCAATVLALVGLTEAVAGSTIQLSLVLAFIFFAAAWFLLGVPLLAWAARAPARVGLQAGLVCAAGLLVLAFSRPKGSDQPLAMYVWLPVAGALLALACGSVAGLVAQRVRGGSPQGGRLAAILAIAAMPAFLPTLLLGERWLDDSRVYDPPAPWPEVALALLIAGIAAWWLKTAPHRPARSG